MGGGSGGREWLEERNHVFDQIADHLIFGNQRDVIGRLVLIRLWNRGNILAGNPRDCVPLGL